MTLHERLRMAQMKDVADMQALRDAAADLGNAEAACSQVLGGDFSLSKEVAEGLLPKEGGAAACCY